MHGNISDFTSFPVSQSNLSKTVDKMGFFEFILVLLTYLLEYHSRNTRIFCGTFFVA